MSRDRSTSAQNRSAVLAWLVRVNSQVSQWASSLSWWRLIVLFLVILIAGNIIGDLLRLKHDRVRVTSSGKETVVTIGGPHGIRITESRDPRKSPVPPPVPAEPGTTAQPPGPPQAADAGRDADSNADTDTDEDAEAVVGHQVVTLRGILGDLGGVVLVILFAYLAAAKIVVKKVAQADAKVRTAVDVAERETMERQLVQARLQVMHRSSPTSCSIRSVPSIT